MLVPWPVLRLMLLLLFCWNKNAQQAHPSGFQRAPLEFCNKPQIHGSYIAPPVVLVVVFEQTLLNFWPAQWPAEQRGKQTGPELNVFVCSRVSGNFHCATGTVTSYMTIIRRICVTHLPPNRWLGILHFPHFPDGKAQTSTIERQLRDGRQEE